MRKNYTVDQLNAMTNREYISALWGDDVLAVIDVQHITPMSQADFLSHCTACGGNWGGMLLTGIRKLYPEVWGAIPNEMGVYAWGLINAVLKELNVYE